MRSSGAMIGSWPRARSAAAVRCGVGFGAREEKPHRSVLHKKIGAGAALQLAAGIGAKCRRVGAAALARNLEGRAAVRSWR